MNPSRIFILRPVATTLFMVAILLVGAVSFRYLPLSALPDIDYPTLQVQTFMPGASPEVMATAVTAPLERQLGQMPGLTQMLSVSSAGASVITLEFSLNVSLDAAEQEVLAKMNAAGNLLPQDLPAPPIFHKFNPADAPVLTLGVTSPTLPLTTLSDIADSRIATKLAQLPGVGVVNLSGGNRPAVRIRANPRQLAAYGLNLDDLRTTISNANVNTPKGTFDGATRAYTINANDQIRDPQEYRDLIIAYRNGAPVRLSDVASVDTAAENDKLGAWVGTTPAMIVNVQRQPGANVIAVVDQVKKVLPQIKASLPPSMDVQVLTDRTTTIRASVADVEFELGLAVVLVVLVIYVFLRSVPATIIPSLSVPLSIVGTFAFMYLADFSLNNLSLMALTIATGFVVDDAIVMIENISRYIEEGEDPLEAALKGAEQIGFTIISLTVSLIAVLIPLLFMGDVVGRLFREFAITLAVTILISAVVSLTLVPMLCAKILKPHKHEDLNPVMRKAEDWFNRLIADYGRALEWVLDRSRATLLVAVGTLVFTVVLWVFIPKGFFPVQDTGVIQGITEAAQSISYGALVERQTALAAAVMKDPDVESVSSFIGVDGTNVTLNSGRMMINLKPHADRDHSAAEIIRRLTEKVKDVSGIKLYMQPVQDLTIETSVSRTQYQFVLEDANGAELAEWVPRVVERLARLPELSDVASDAQNSGLSAYVELDRDTATRLGISFATIDNALYDAFGQRMVSTIFTQTSQYRVILESDPKLQNTLDSLGSLYVPSSGGQVPLSAVAKISERAAPLQINHLHQFPANIVSFNLSPGTSLGQAVDAILKAEKDIGLPPSVLTSFQGAALAFQASLSNEIYLILAAIITVYIVLGVLYESFVHPITILSTLPSASVGALLALLIFRMDLGVIGIIGIVLLIGIVKKNAIMMIDFALEAERNHGLTPREAITQACLLRFRPIMMTTMAALLGALPLMVGGGVGSELRQPLGVSIVGGLIVSQLLTLFTTPVIYLYFDELAIRFRGEKKPLPLDTGEIPAPEPKPAE